MANLKWRGDAKPVPQVNTVTVGGTYSDGQVYSVTINGKTVTYTGVSGNDNTAVAANLKAALAASTIPEFVEVTWTVSSLVITGTGPSSGKPFTNTSGATGTGTLVTATTTAATGPNHWSNALNWSTGSVPVSTDDVYIENSSVDILYGIDQNAVTLASLNIAASYTGKIGLPNMTSTGASGYYEYREKYLKISATACNIGLGDGAASGRIKLALGSNAATTTVYKTGQPIESGLPSLLLTNTHASSVLNAVAGSIGLAVEFGQTSTVPAIRIGSVNNPASDVVLNCGSGCTLTAISQSGGIVTVASAVTTWTKTGGTSTNLGTSTITTLTQDGAATHYNQSSGTITTATIRGRGSRIDNSRDPRSRTYTNSTFTGGGHILDPFKTVTFTNPMTIDSESLKECNFGNAPFSLQRT